MFNTKIEDRIEVSIPEENTISICRKVVADIGWRILGQSKNRIQCKEVAVSGISFNWPAEVEIIISSNSPSSSTILLNGSIFGFGPVQKGHLKGQIGNLKNRIEIKVDEETNNSNTSNNKGSSESLSDEITKLAALHKKGILTDDEFQSAKKRLINGENE